MPMQSADPILVPALVAALGWLLYAKLHPTKIRNPLQQMSIERLTTDGKTTGSANISPDGKYVVYEAEKNDKELKNDKAKGQKSGDQTAADGEKAEGEDMEEIGRAHV